MSFSPVVQVRKLLDKMKSDRHSPRLKRFPSRTSSEEARDSSSSPYHIPAFKQKKTGKQEITGVNQFNYLPCEATLYIFSFLSARDLCHVGEVSKDMYALATDEMVWKSVTRFDFGITAPFADTWRETYAALDSLSADGMWEGMSKWVEPEGFDNEQKTTARLHFVKRSQHVQSPLSPSNPRASPTAIHRVDSQTHSSPVKSTPDSPHKNAPYRIIGSGVTVNCTQPSPFRIEGRLITHDADGCTFEWNKQFDKHTSVYSGRMDYRTRTVSGTIDYHDGGTHWKGIFSYTKMNSRGIKLILA